MIDTNPGVGSYDFRQYCIDFSSIVTAWQDGGKPLKSQIVLRPLNGSCDEVVVDLPVIDPRPIKTSIAEGTTVSLNNLIIGGTMPSNSQIGQSLTSMNTHLEVLGTLEVDVNFYRFTNGSIIVLGPNGKIVVKSGSTLLINNGTWIKGCRDMWQSIEVEPNGTLIVDDSGNTLPRPVRILEGTNAISASPNSSVTVNNTIFRNNYVSIYSSDGEGVSWDIKNNQFFTIPINRIPTQLGRTLLPPFEGQIGKAGIEVTKAGTGNSTFHPIDNTFRNLGNGIVARNSNASVTGGLFEDMLVTGDHSPEGNGIYFQGGNDGFRLTQTGKERNLANPTFDNCRIGIFVVNGQSIIKNNGMVNVQTGVFNALSKNRLTYIAENEISASKVGISHLLNQPTMSSTMFDNDIIIDGDLQRSTGIRINDFPIGSGYNVYDNQIDVQNARFGMNISGVNNVDVRRNNIRLENNANDTEGMRIDGSRNIFAECNRFSKTDDSLNPDQYGIKYNEVEFSRFQCNDFENIPYCFNLNGENTSTTMRGNVFENYYHGMQYESQARTSAHPHEGNLWGDPVNSNTAGVEHLGSDDVFILLSRFEVNSLVNESYLPNTTNYTPNLDPLLGDIEWFKDEPNTIPIYTCYSTSLCPDLSNEEWIPDAMDFQVADGEVVSFDYTESQTWKARYNLYRKLRENPVWLSESPLLDNFFTDQMNTEIGKIDEAARQIEKTIALYEDESTLLIEQINAQLGDTGTPIDAIVAANNDEVSVQNALEDDLEKIGIIGSKIRDKISGIVPSLESALTIDAESMQIGNTQLITQIYLSTLSATDEKIFSNQQISELKFIANQCPFTGGSAVYIARGMLGLPPIMDMDAICAPAQNTLGKPNDIKTTMEAPYTIYPNPAHDILTITFDMPTDKEQSISIVNITGKIVQTEAIAEGLNNISMDISNLPMGMYYLKYGSYPPTLINIID